MLLGSLRGTALLTMLVNSALPAALIHRTLLAPDFLRLTCSCAFVIHPITIAYRTSFLKMRLLDPVVSQLRHPLATDAVVHKSPVFITVKIVVNDRPPVKIMRSRRCHMIGPLMSAHAEKWLVEMVASNKNEEIRAQPETASGNIHADSAEHPDATHKNRSHRQRCPADVAVRVRLAPANPRRTPRIIRHPHPAIAGLNNPTTVVERNIAPGVIRSPE